MAFIVEIQAGCWLAPWCGDPGRTLVEESAKRFFAKKEAELALKAAREFRGFPDAKVVKV